MNPTHFSSILFSTLIILAFADDQPLKVEEHPSMDCLSTTCGYISITYPFWVEGQQPSHCGFQNFKLSCKNDILILNDVYQVKEIFYDNQSLLMVNEDFVNRDCPSLQWNISFSLTPFSISSLNRELVFLFNCSEPQHDYYKIPCNGAYVKFAHGGDDLGKLGTCQSELMPVVDYWGVDIKDYLRVVKNGFLVEWTAADCTECRESNGQCGYSQKNDNFMCICPDGAHWRSCSGNGGSKRIIIKGSAAGAGFLVVCLSLALYFYKHRKDSNSVISWKKNLNNSKKIETLLEEYGSVTPKRYSYSNVKKLTKAFQEKLGQGGFGTVYKGTLSNGHVVAVKILNDSKGDGEEFINEVASICRTSHVNVVSLLGFCHEGSKRALIYDYMCNGSLAKLLYLEEPKTSGYWQKLYEIAIGIARGLEYLHRGCNTRIVHFDIKPHNILLDQNFCPKISDFGLAKLCLKKESIISIAGARGTIGYIAPEVFSRNFGVVSSKSDVYSYGMMVLEIVGGRKNPNEGVENSSEVYFPHWIYAQLNQNSHLLTCGVTDESEETVRKMVLVGLWCIQTLPENRPSMSRVIEMMEGSVDDLQIPPKPYLSSPFGSIIGTSSVQDICSIDCSSSVDS